VLICRPVRQAVTQFSIRQAGGLMLAARRGAGLLPSLLRGRWTLLPRPLDDPKVQGWIKQQAFDVGLHAMGVIYRRPVLDAFRLGILNAHIGYLPSFRGRSVVEWSLLADAPLGATVFFIDEGIDTGERIVAWRPAPERLPASVDDLRRVLFDADGVNYAASLRALQQPCLYRNDVALGHRFYAMSGLLKGVAQFALAEHRSASRPLRFDGADRQGNDATDQRSVAGKQ
jgi:hypothetical protein